MSSIRNIIKNKVFIIAEIGVNHNGSISIAKKSIIEAKKSGADAVKFQSFNADDLVLKSAPKVKYQLNNKVDETHYKMLRKLEFSKDKFKTLIRFCKSKNIKFISTPYDQKNAEYLLQQGIKIIKIASADLVDFQLLSFLKKKKYRTHIINRYVKYIRNKTNIKIIQKYKIMNNLFLLQCVSNYPANKEKSKFKCYTNV